MKLKFRIWDIAKNKFIDMAQYLDDRRMFLVDREGILLDAEYYDYEGYSINPSNDINLTKVGDVYVPRYIISYWTTMVDKNGKEIYEGDRIKGDGYGPYPVFWNKGTWCSSCYRDGEPLSRYRDIEVINNIWETPDTDEQ